MTVRHRLWTLLTIVSVLLSVGLAAASQADAKSFWPHHIGNSICSYDLGQRHSQPRSPAASPGSSPRKDAVPCAVGRIAVNSHLMVGAATRVGAETAAGGGARFVAGSDGTVVDTLGGNVPDAISLGKYPAYVDLGAQTGARTFSMSDEAWNAMSPAEQWARNQQFLDQAIARGSQIRLASPLTAENLTGGYGQEIEYLLKQGFTPSADGTMMLPPGG